MLRCNESAGTFTVTMLTQDPEERRQYLGAHADVVRQDVVDGRIVNTVLEASPIFSNVTSFEGELCVHEIQALSMPAKYVSPELIFRIQKVE